MLIKFKVQEREEAMAAQMVDQAAQSAEDSALLCNMHLIDRGKVATAIRGRVRGDNADRLAEAFKVLGDPTRVKILDLLSREELCVCDLSAILGLTQSAVSHQLRLLRMHRLVKSRRERRCVFYSLDDDHIVRLLSEGLDHVSHD